MTKTNKRRVASIVAIALMTFVADLIYPLIDPRIRYQ